MRLVPIALLFPALLFGTSPQIWFAPLDDFTRQSNINGGVIPPSAAPPTDYLNLFAAAAPWQHAAGHVAVFKIYNLYGAMPDASLQQMFSFLAQHHIDLAIEFGPLIATGGCGLQASGGAIEGFNGGTAQNVVSWITRNGGTLKYVAMDEPFFFANIYNDSGACHWTPQQVATNAMTSLNILKAAFPGLQIGDIEPMTANGQAADWLSRYTAWMDAFESVTGSKLAFFHSDTIVTIPSWMSDIVATRAETSKRGIPFGIIYNGLASDTSDEQWTSHAEQFFTTFELANGSPDQAIFQTWEAHPLHNLPETTPSTFTWLLDRYLRPRTNLSVTVAGSHASGRLTDQQANAVSGGTVNLSAQAVAGPGIIATYTLTGTVPSNISSGIVQACVNLCGSAGNNNMSLYSFHYADSAQQATLDFSNGLNGWGVDGNGTALVQVGSDEGGPLLKIAATPSQFTFVNSSRFTMTPGSSYTLTVRARISVDSVGSGYFALIFLIGNEVGRNTLNYAPGTLPLGNAQTGGDGSFAMTLTPESPPYLGVAAYAGSDSLWPAQATTYVGSAAGSPVLKVTKSHVRNFNQGQTGAAYSVTVTNDAAAGPTSGTITATEMPPAGMTVTSMSGAGWNCALGGTTCTRDDSLSPGGSYPIGVTVNVSSSAPSTLANQVTVSGGGGGPVSATDPTTIYPLGPCDINLDLSVDSLDILAEVHQAGLPTPSADDFNRDGAVNVLDIQIVVNAALGFGCAAK